MRNERHNRVVVQVGEGGLDNKLEVDNVRQGEQAEQASLFGLCKTPVVQGSTKSMEVSSKRSRGSFSGEPLTCGEGGRVSWLIGRNGAIENATHTLGVQCQFERVGKGVERAESVPAIQANRKLPQRRPREVVVRPSDDGRIAELEDLEVWRRVGEEVSPVRGEGSTEVERAEVRKVLAEPEGRVLKVGRVIRGDGEVREVLERLNRVRDLDGNEVSRPCRAIRA